MRCGGSFPKLVVVVASSFPLLPVDDWRLQAANCQDFGFKAIHVTQPFGGPTFGQLTQQLPISRDLPSTITSLNSPEVIGEETRQNGGLIN
jgi:hypothetical protein